MSKVNYNNDATKMTATGGDINGDLQINGTLRLAPDAVAPLGEITSFLNAGVNLEIQANQDLWLSPSGVLRLNPGTTTFAHKELAVYTDWFGIELASLNSAAHRFGNLRLTQVGYPVDDSDASTKQYVDDVDAATRIYVDSNKLDVSGGTVTGSVLVPTPTQAMNPSTKMYSDVEAGATTTWTPYTNLTDYGGSFAGLNVTRVGKIVNVTGLIKPTTAIALTGLTPRIVGTIPPGYLPTTQIIGSASMSITTGGYSTVRIDVTTGGNILVTTNLDVSWTTTGWLAVNINYRAA